MELAQQRKIVCFLISIGDFRSLCQDLGLTVKRTEHFTSTNINILGSSYPIHIYVSKIQNMNIALLKEGLSQTNSGDFVFLISSHKVHVIESYHAYLKTKVLPPSVYQCKLMNPYCDSTILKWVIEFVSSRAAEESKPEIKVQFEFLKMIKDVQLTILSYYPMEDIAKTGTVSKYWNKIMWETQESLDFSKYIVCPKLTTPCLDMILSSCGMRLEKLNLAGCNALSTLSDVAKLTNLKELNLSRCRNIGTSASYSSLSSLVLLRSLNLADTRRFSHEELFFLKHLTNLRTLDLSYNNLTHWTDHAEIWKTLPRLYFIAITSCFTYPNDRDPGSLPNINFLI
eukprot:TRINITY_DN11834_c0_g1_i1.p1 TRINITY_DN11834_c0_g1~~TRINITY_DN11834_c0_g1_i1.p1  ORF type:complete len:355 (+),score=43.22 TRINITY_DN11834_c0_g1_i1:45-1067(+)